MIRQQIEELTSRIDKLEEDYRGLLTRIEERVNKISDKLDKRVNKEEITEENEIKDIELDEEVDIEPEKPIGKQKESTPKEKEVLEWLKQGLTITETAKEMQVDKAMICRYRKTLREKGLLS